MQRYHQASKFYNDIETFLESDEFNAIFKGVAQDDVDRKKKIMRESQFERGFVIPVDPKANYGRSYKLFRLYKASDGLRILKEVEPLSVVSNAPFLRVEVYLDGFTITDEKYSRKQRGELIEKGVVVKS